MNSREQSRPGPTATQGPAGRQIWGPIRSASFRLNGGSHGDA